MAIRKSWYIMILTMLMQQPIFTAVSELPESQNTYGKKSLMLAIAAGLIGIGALVKKSFFTPKYQAPVVVKVQPVFNPGERVPIVYRDEYNFPQSFLNTMLSYLHPFDTQKYRTIADTVVTWLGIDKSQLHKPDIVSDVDLALVHTPNYLNSLRSSATISEIIDMGQLLSWVPNSFFQNNLLVPMKYAVGGTIEAAKLALQYGWAINLAGGYHHAKADKGEGGCVYADIPIAIKKLWEVQSDLKVMIIDLDAHQSNGIESILGNNRNVYIFDMFNKNVAPVELELLEEKPIYTYYPGQEGLVEVEPIRPLGKLPNVYAVPLEGGKLSSELYGISMPDIFVERCVDRAIETNEYMKKLQEELPKAYEDCINYFRGQRPDLIIYNAGTDIYEDDIWGCMNINKDGIYARDHYIFDYVMRDKKIPILMLPAGGYFQESGRVIGTSIVGLVRDVVLPALKQKKQQ